MKKNKQQQAVVNRTTLVTSMQRGEKYTASDLAKRTSAGVPSVRSVLSDCVSRGVFKQSTTDPLFCIRRMDRASTNRTRSGKKHGRRNSAHVPEATAAPTLEKKSQWPRDLMSTSAEQPVDTLRLNERLNNWAKVMRQGGNASGDRDDARLINAAWARLTPFHKRLLQMHYVWGAHREFICRRLKIRHRPWSVFEIELVHARTAVARQIACALDERVERGRESI